MRLGDILEQAIRRGRRTATAAQVKGPVWYGRPAPRSYAVAPCGMAVPARMLRRHSEDCDHG